MGLLNFKNARKEWRSGAHFSDFQRKKTKMLTQHCLTMRERISLQIIFNVGKCWEMRAAVIRKRSVAWQSTICFSSFDSYLVFTDQLTG